jgi:hypothetical protein
MKQIRRNVFETNSSSTHSICISKKPVVPRKHIHFGIGEYGWESSCVNAVDYLYTAILEQGDSSELLEQLKFILDNYSIEYEFDEPIYKTSSDGKYKWIDYGYVDHGYETREFIDAVLSNDDLLMRCLFGDSFVYTGNDNGCDHDNMCYAAYETIWDDDWNETPNPNHDSENYDYFFKGN